MNRTQVFFFVVTSFIVFSLVACSPAVQPTATVAPTQLPQATAELSTSTVEVPTATEAPTESPVVSSGGCSNPYLPVVVGATWSYKLTGPIPDTFTHTILAAESDSFTEQDVFGTGVSRQGKWNCDNGNLIALNPPSGSSGTVSAENVTVDFQTKDLSGVTLPATVNAGDTWSQALTLEGTETINGTSYPASNQLTSDCKAIGIESVSVEAGTFDAMRVECQTSMKISIQLGETPMDNTFNLTGTNWYAENVGLVKTVTTGMGLDSTTELVSYNIP